MQTKSEYVVDQLRSEISILQTELKELQEECKVGSWVSFMFGIAVGIIIGTAITWL